MEKLSQFADGLGPRLQRYSLAVVLLWIGALKFVDPSPVVGLLNASLSFLAFDAFVYLLGTAKVVCDRR